MLAVSRDVHTPHELWVIGAGRYRPTEGCPLDAVFQGVWRRTMPRWVLNSGHS